MPRQLATGRGVQWVLRTAKQHFSLSLDLCYDRGNREWNCWSLEHRSYFIGRGATPEASYRNFLATNNISHDQTDESILD